MKTSAGLTNIVIALALAASPSTAENLEAEFKSPPDAARPGVYWYFMDGNQNREEMVADLHAMKKVGIGSVLFLEVNIGVPTGPVSFMSAQWQDNIVHAVKTTQELGMEFILGTGPGWSGSGGSWVKPEDSMQHLVGSSTQVQGPSKFEKPLPVAAPHKPNRFAGMSGEHSAARDQWFRDVAVLAFPTPQGEVAKFDNDDIKTLKDVRPYSIRHNYENVPTFVMPQADYPEPGAAQVIDATRTIDLTSKMKPDGTLSWDVPEGNWTVMRFVARSTGQTTRPAPRAGHGFECDKFNADAYRKHWDNYQGKLIKQLPPITPGKGLTTIHLDSWEMSSQNWSAAFRTEFTKRRGYDPQPFYPAYMGMVVGSREHTERFLWDMRKTSQELVLENHAGAIKEIAHEHGLKYSNEPYDMNPAGNMDLGSVSDYIGCEFWNANGGPDTQYSCIEAVSVAHTMGKEKVFAEAFTTAGMRYLNYPTNMKDQTDWAFAMGINSIIFHTFQHQPLGEGIKPGMTMGPYGVQWHRNRPMWGMFDAYHQYLSRCSSMLRQGQAVADILYLTPEGAPMIFEAPDSALAGTTRLRDKKGYNFDAVTPRILKMRAKTENRKICFKGGSSYSVLVLPRVGTMTPETLEFISKLVESGATVIGNPPRKSPSLAGFPECDNRIEKLAAKLWGKSLVPERKFGKGRVILDSDSLPKEGTAKADKPLLPHTGNWIWFDKGNPAQSTEVGKVEFLYTYQIPDLKLVSKARIEATADNSLTLRVGWDKALTGDNFNKIEKANILPLLKQGENSIRVLAENGGDSANPAGFIAAIHLTYTDGTDKVIGTDNKWQAKTAKTGEWSPAKVLGPGNMAPWNLKAPNTIASKAPELYPNYESTAAALKDMGIVEDFTSTGPVRYGHRRTETDDFYFVANTTDEQINPDCTFRVAGRSPQLWNPVTGKMRSLSQYVTKNGVTTIPMQFGPHQSFFVIFPRSEESKKPSGSENFAKTVPVATLDGPWEVSFDPKWGGPAKITFDKLIDWTTHPERGVKYYSGTATYKKTFDVTAPKGKEDTSVHLELGTVHDMARVKLNGKDLGVVWCAPWQVDITDTVKAKGNKLEIEIVNRWPNRVIGDKQEPDKHVRTLKWDSGLLGGKEYKAGRYTFSTSSLPGSLLPSGLIGPVRLMSNK